MSRHCGINKGRIRGMTDRSGTLEVLEHGGNVSHPPQTEGADDLEASERREFFGRLIAMKLYELETEPPRQVDDFLGGPVHAHANNP
jgi:hypothetical protein